MSGHPYIRSFMYGPPATPRIEITTSHPSQSARRMGHPIICGLVEMMKLRVGTLLWTGWSNGGWFRLCLGLRVWLWMGARQQLRLRRARQQLRIRRRLLWSVVDCFAIQLCRANSSVGGGLKYNPQTLRLARNSYRHRHSRYRFGQSGGVLITCGGGHALQL